MTNYRGGEDEAGSLKLLPSRRTGSRGDLIMSERRHRVGLHYRFRSHDGSNRGGSERERDHSQSMGMAGWGVKVRGRG